MKDSKEMQEQISQKQYEVFEKLVGAAYFDLGDNTRRPYYVSNSNIGLPEAEDGYLEESLSFLEGLQTNSAVSTFSLRAGHSYIDAAIHFLANFIQHNTALKSFSWVSEGESDVISVAAMFAEYKHPKLETIRVLSEALVQNTTLETLSLAFKSTRCEEVCVALPKAYFPLVEGLRLNKSLTRLRIGHGLCEDTISLLATILMDNTTLLTLSLEERDIICSNFSVWAEKSTGAFQALIEKNSTLIELELSMPYFCLTQKLKLLNGLLVNRSLFVLKLYTTDPILHYWTATLQEDINQRPELIVLADKIFNLNHAIGTLDLKESEPKGLQDKIEQYCNRNQQFQKIAKLKWLLAFMAREVNMLSKELNNQIPNVMSNCVRDIIQFLPDTFPKRVYSLGYQSFRPHLAAADWPTDIVRPLTHQFSQSRLQGSSSSSSNSTVLRQREEERSLDQVERKTPS